MSDQQTPYRAMVAGVAAMPAVELRGQKYTGPYLSTLLAIDPEQPAAESARTPQLIGELGRLVAAAKRDQDMVECDYRVWREKLVWELTHNAEKATEAGFVGKVTKTGVEEWLHTLPEYRQWYDRMTQAAEVWTTLHHALEAARARQKQVWAYERQGASDQTRRSYQSEAFDQASGPANGVANGLTNGNSYHGGENDEETIAEAEAAATRTVRTPLPPLPAVVPPPPGMRAEAAGESAAKIPPPPPLPPR